MIEPSISIKGKLNSPAKIKGKTNASIIKPKLENIEVSPSAEEQILVSNLDGFKSVKIKSDKNLQSKNIKANTTIFGVEGDLNVVDTSEGTINAENITPDAIAFSKGKKITGTMLATTATNPLVISGDYTALNQEYPYFLLRRPSGSKFGSSMVKVNAAAIPQEWVEGKNIILRYNFNNSTNTGILELAITDWGNRFAFSYNGGKLEFSVKDSLTGESRSCISYCCSVTKEELLTLTSDKWRNSYGSSSLGNINTLYAYSRDESIKTTSHGGSDGIPSNNQLISFEKNITGYEGRSVYAPAGGKEIVYLPKSTIATKENITSEKIVAGNTVLGVQGNAIEFLPNPTFIAEAVNKYSGPTIINKKMTSASNTTSFSYSISAQVGKRVIAFMSLLNNPSYTSNPATPNDIEGWELVHRLQSGKYNNWRNWTTYIYTKIAESETETITFTTQETCGAADICLAAFDSSDEVEVLASVTGWKALAGYAQPVKVGDLIFDSYMTTQELTVIGPKYTSYGNKRSYLITVNTDADQVSLDRKYDYTHNTVVLRFKTQEADVLKPGNIKKGVKILNIEGEMEEGIDTSDATATPQDICMNKTAYVNGEKITGTLWEAGITTMTSKDIVDNGHGIDIKRTMDQDYLFRKNGSITYNVKYADMANAIGLTSEKIMKGNTVIGVSGNATSDANATAEDIVKGKTAYVNGEKIVGTYEESGENNNYNATISAEGKTSFSVTSGLRQLKSIDVQGVTSLYGAFKNCASLTKIEKILNTTQVTNTSYMFDACSLLEEIPFFDTSRVTTATYMFQNCKKIKKIPLLDTSKVTSTNGMFNGCTELEEVPLLDLSSCTDVSAMFPRCTNLKEIPLFNISNATNTGGMLQFCSSLETIPLLDVSKSTSMQNFFYQCKALKSIPKLNTSNNTSMYYMFYECYAITDIPELDASNVNNLTGAFYCPKLTNFGGLKNIGKSYTRASANYSSYDYGLSNSSNLTYESLINVMNGVYDLNLTYNVANGGTLYTQKIKLGSTNLAKLTAEEIAIATAKGWTVS